MQDGEIHISPYLLFRSKYHCPNGTNVESLPDLSKHAFSLENNGFTLGGVKIDFDDQGAYL